MKNLNTLNDYRVHHPFFRMGNESCGAFLIPRKHNGTLVVLASIEEDEWEHVSVSLKTQCPTWDDMCRVKDLFFEDEEEAFQFHPKKSEYVNQHPFCLHLWRKQGEGLETPSIKTKENES